jgi:alpha-N-arabinofuranosidase
VNSNGIVKRTHFHAMAMYANDLEPRVGSLSLIADNLSHGNDTLPVADAIATVDDSGRKWALALVNRHPDKALSCKVQFNKEPIEGTYDAIVLEGDSPEAFNDIEHPSRVAPEIKKITFAHGVAELPPHSLTIVKLAHSAGR